MDQTRVKMSIVSLDEEGVTQIHAEFDVPAAPHRALHAYQQALTDLSKPDVLLLPDGLTAEEAERIRGEWVQRHTA